MTIHQIVLLCATSMAVLVAGPAGAQQPPVPYVRIADIDIDPAQLEPYKGAVKEHAVVAVAQEPGVLALYAVADKENPTHVTVFEIYADQQAYMSHLQTAHFIKYKTITQGMVKALKIRDTIPIGLSAKTK